MLCAVTVFEGTQVALSMTFRALDGALADPTDILVRVSPPGVPSIDYTTPDPTITNDSVGQWTFTFPTGLAPGTWKVYVAGTAGVLASTETAISVRASEVAAP